MNGIFCKLYIKAIIREAIEIKIYEKAGRRTIKIYGGENDFTAIKGIMPSNDVKNYRNVIGGRS